MPPGESANIENITKVFSGRYCEQNPGQFVDPENAFFIAYAIMMLNTDACVKLLHAKYASSADG
jgi:Sec7-like guanine-nucleotide exchange factor|eukprot:COSAG01_NODE_1622_length_9712_cov_40.535005_3_plen_64_part_00